MKDSSLARQERAETLRPRVQERVRSVGSERKAAGEIGVSNSALAKFIAGEVPYDATLDKYEAWLSGETSDSSNGGTRKNPVPGLEGVGLLELYKRFDAIEASSIPEHMKILKIDALAAAVREVGRTVDGEAARERAKAAGVESESARERTRALRGQQPVERSIGAVRSAKSAGVGRGRKLADDGR